MIHPLRNQVISYTRLLPSLCTKQMAAEAGLYHTCDLSVMPQLFFFLSLFLTRMVVFKGTPAQVNLLLQQCYILQNDLISRKLLASDFKSS